MRAVAARLLARWTFVFIFMVCTLPAHAMRPGASADLPARVVAQARTARNELRLTFVDEFNDLDLRRAGKGVWTTSFGYGGIDSFTLTNNRELQLYVDPEFRGASNRALGLQPFQIRNGVLDIIARRTPPQLRSRLWNYPYYSGLLTTRQSFSQQYGYFEMRARVPSIHGTWSAFWLLPRDGHWPPEIDVMEHLGREPDVYYAGYHANPGGRREGGAQPARIQGQLEQFHRYGVLWDEAKIIWYLDGAPVRQIPTPDDMHVPMYMLVNLAIGGEWAQNPWPWTPFPATMSIDYIRAYALRPASSG